MIITVSDGVCGKEDKERNTKRQCMLTTVSQKTLNLSHLKTQVDHELTKCLPFIQAGTYD